MFKWCWHCLLGELWPLKPMSFELLQDHPFVSWNCQNLFQPIFGRAGICRFNFKQFLTPFSSQLFVCFGVASAGSRRIPSEGTLCSNSLGCVTNMLYPSALAQPTESMFWFCPLSPCYRVCPVTTQFQKQCRHCAGVEVRSPVTDEYRGKVEIITVLV